MISLRRTFRVLSVLAVVSFAGLIPLSCGGDDDDGDSSGGSGGAGGSSGDASVAGDSGWDTGTGGVVNVSDGGVLITDDAGNQVMCYYTTCAGKLLQCGDCEDNDGDGAYDWQDKECLGPCDNTEGPGLDSDVGGTTGTSCGVDCYFDFGNGPGNDNCFWDHRCDPLIPEKTKCGTFVPSMLGSKDCPDTQPKECAEYCMPYTPNGCDCFGCCTFPELAAKGPDGGTGYVWIGNMDADNNSICTFADILDPTKCPPCTPVGNCLNDCAPCELCLGKTTLPPQCYPPDAGTDAGWDGGIPGQCPDGIQPCGLAGQAQCPASYFCLSGCCRPSVN